MRLEREPAEVKRDPAVPRRGGQMSQPGVLGQRQPPCQYRRGRQVEVYAGLRPEIAMVGGAELEREGACDGRLDASAVVQRVRGAEHPSCKIDSAVSAGRSRSR